MQGAPPLASPGLNGARHWLSLPYRCLGGRRNHSQGTLFVGSAETYRFSRRGAGGGSPRQNQLKISPFPGGEGGWGAGGMGEKSKLKAGLAGDKDGKPPAGHLLGRFCKCRRRSNAGDARGGAPCIRKQKISPFPGGEGGQGGYPSPSGKGGKKAAKERNRPATKKASPPKKQKERSPQCATTAKMTA